MSILNTQTAALFVAGFGLVMAIVLGDSIFAGVAVSLGGLAWSWKLQVQPQILASVILAVGGTLLVLRQAEILPATFGAMLALAAAIIGSTANRVNSTTVLPDT